MKKLFFKSFKALLFVLLLIGCNNPLLNYEEELETEAARYSGYYKIKSRSSGKLMEVANASTSDGANVQQWSDNGNYCQQWELIATGSYYKIKNRNSGKLLEVAGASTTDGANIQQWPDNGNYCQQWAITDVGSGYVKIENRNSGDAADVEGASSSDGANILQWPYGSGAANREWQLISVTSGTDPTAVPTNPPSGSWTYQTCDQWGSFSDGGYTIYNNIWGLESGTQCLYGNSYRDWKVTANLPSVGHVTSYPNTSKELSINVDSLGSCTSSFSVSRPSGGDYITAYDIWYDNHAYEVMLWMNRTGQVGPIASAWDGSGNPIPEYTNQYIGGHTWDVYKGSNGSNQVFSFLRSNTNSATVDIKAISQWIRDRGWFGNANLHKIEFGFEISATYQSRDFYVTNYSLSYSSGGSTPAPTQAPTQAPTTPPGGGGDAKRMESYNFNTYYMRHHGSSQVRIEQNVSPYEDSQFRIVAGLADSSKVSFESVNNPGYFLRHSGYVIYLNQNNGSQIFREDATFARVSGLANSSWVSYRSHNFPDRYIRHYSYGLRIDPISTDLDRQDATFREVN